MSKKVYFQLDSEEERKISRDIEAIQIKYARVVRKYVEKLPRKYHKTSFFVACDVNYPVSLIFSDFESLLTEEAEGE